MNPTVRPVNFFDFSNRAQFVPFSSSTENSMSQMNPVVKPAGQRRLESAILNEIDKIETAEIPSVFRFIDQTRMAMESQRNLIKSNQNEQELVEQEQTSTKQVFDCTIFKSPEARQSKIQINYKNTEENKTKLKTLTDGRVKLDQELDKLNATLDASYARLQELTADIKILYYQLIKVAKQAEANEILEFLWESTSQIDLEKIKHYGEMLGLYIPTEQEANLNGLISSIQNHIDEINSFHQVVQQSRAQLIEQSENSEREELKQKIVDAANSIYELRKNNRQLFEDIKRLVLN